MSPAAPTRALLALAAQTVAAAIEKLRGDGIDGDAIAALLALPKRAIRALPFVGTAAQVPLKAGPIRFDRAAFIERCHDLGLRVDFWTVDDPALARRLIGLGADGIMTDDPARMAPALRAR